MTTTKPAGALELKPCPFCGGKPDFEPHEDREGHFTEARIWCIGDCIGPHTTAAYFDDAVRQWNTRAPAEAGVGDVLTDSEVLDIGHKLSAALTSKYCDEGFWRNVPAANIVKALDDFLYGRRPPAIRENSGTNPVADSTGEKTGTHGASKEAGGHSRGGLTPVSPPIRESMREEIARIINPDLFIEYDLLVAKGTIAANGKPWAEVVFSKKIEGLLAKADAILALSPPAERLGTEWRPIETAPKDGTILFLLVEQNLFAEASSNPTEDDLSFRTIGHNNFDHDGTDCWQFAGWDWAQDQYTQARGSPTHWQPLPALALTQQDNPNAQ